MLVNIVSLIVGIIILSGMVFIAGFRFGAEYMTLTKEEIEENDAARKEAQLGALIINNLF